jgi:all-trans-retinol 13,14-reductase
MLTNYGIVAWIVYGVLSGGPLDRRGARRTNGRARDPRARYRCHAVKILNCTSAAFFAFSLMTTIAVGPALFKNYDTFLTWSVFAIVTWVTVLIGLPFTLQYAREQAPREVWHHPLFMHLNVILTVAFGMMFTVNAGFGVIALITGHLLTLGLLLPISLLIACIVFSMQYPQRYSQRFAPDWVATQAAKEGVPIGYHINELHQVLDKTRQNLSFCSGLKIPLRVSSSLSEGARKGRFPRGKWPGRSV